MQATNAHRLRNDFLAGIHRKGDRKYYRLSHERNVYLPDKTVDDRYYPLTLFALAKELKALRKTRTFLPGELINMDLVVGFPPLYYRGQYKKFREYFYRDGRLVHFEYMGDTDWRF